MNEKRMVEIWKRHNSGKCDCSDGDAYHNEPECYISLGYLKALEKAKGLEEALEGFLERECCQDTYEEEHCGECGYCKGENALAQWEKEK